ncbi:hypothetical protein ACKWTF_001573 [Chironomus riparius]
MDLKIIFIFFINLGNIFAQSESLSCTYLNVGSTYTCNLKLINTRGLNNFATITGTHLSGRNDNYVLSVTSVAGSVSPNIPSIICNKFRGLQMISMNNVGIKSFLIEGLSSFTYCNTTTTIEICNNKISEIDERSFMYNVGLLELKLWNLGLTNLPEKVFHNLINLQKLHLHKNNFTSLPNNLFRYLKRLLILNLSDNFIVTPNYKWFDTLISLNSFYIDNNLIEDLPTDVFSSLTDLIYISMSGNNLTILHSDPFGVLPKLKTIQAINCQLKAIDENLIDNTGTTQISLTNNTCVNEVITDSSGSRYSMRIILADCFRNYAKYMGQTTTTMNPITTVPTTTLPSGCVSGNESTRICKLEDKSQQLSSNFESFIQEIVNLKNQNIVINETVQQLQDQITVLTNRPCSCA